MGFNRLAPRHELASADKFPPSLWTWPNFTPQEMACKGTGRLMIDPESMDCLQSLRDQVGKPLVIQSAYRTREHNKAVGGAAGSMHLAACAFDVSMKGHDPHEFEEWARACGFTGFGFYPDQGFMHIDTGPARWWGEKFPAYQDEKPAPDLDAPPPDLDAPGPQDGPKIANKLKRKQSA